VQVQTISSKARKIILHGVWFGDVFHEHVFDLALNVSWLVADRDLGQAGQIHKRQCEHIGGKDPQINRERRNAGIFPCLELGVFDNLCPYLVEVCVKLIR
jgi:hypothetical protein